MTQFTRMRDAAAKTWTISNDTKNPAPRSASSYRHKAEGYIFLTIPDL